MNNEPARQERESVTPSDQPGFFSRLLDKFDQKLKDKAEQKSRQSGCGCSDDKGGKCC